jgi:hypothetical protein
MMMRGLRGLAAAIQLSFGNGQGRRQTFRNARNRRHLGAKDQRKIGKCNSRSLG